jgi:hypothetical protein
MLRDLAILLVGLLLGVGIGYFGESYVRPYVSSYSFSSTLSLAYGNSTTVSVGQSITFKAMLDTSIPSELQSFEAQLKQFALNNKPITLMMRVQNSTYWNIIETRNTLYAGQGEATFMYTFSEAGSFDFKAVWEGDNVLKPSESGVVTITVS